VEGAVAAIPKPRNAQKGFQKIIHEVIKVYTHLTEDQIMHYILQIKTNNNNSLKGLTVNVVIERIGDLMDLEETSKIFNIQSLRDLLTQKCAQKKGY
jgi:hypothetical protein